MYNRYVPSPDGRFRREIVSDAPAQIQLIEPAPRPGEKAEPAYSERPIRQESAKQETCEQKKTQEHPKERACSGSGTIRHLIPSTIDTGDLLVLLILLLLLVDGDEDDYLSVILTIAAFILL